MPKKTAVSPNTSIDIDRLVREEVTEWFTSNRKELETVFRRVADQVEAVWKARVDELEDEVRRMRGVLTMVRSQVGDKAVD